MPQFVRRDGAVNYVCDGTTSVPGAFRPALVLGVAADGTTVDLRVFGYTTDGGNFATNYGASIVLAVPYDGGFSTNSWHYPQTDR